MFPQLEAIKRDLGAARDEKQLERNKNEQLNVEVRGRTSGTSELVEFSSNPHFSSITCIEKCSILL